MRPRWSSGPNSPQLEFGGFCFQRWVMSEVVPADGLGDHRGLVAALELDGHAPGGLDAPFQLLVLRKGEARPDLRPCRHGRSKAHLVQAVVDAHLAVGKLERRLDELR